MSLQEQMIAANIRNWLTDLAVGAKAMNITVRCAPSSDDTAWRVEAKTWDNPTVDGIITVYIHNITVVAEAADFELNHRKFKKKDFYYGSFEGEDFFIFNGVKFANLVGRRGDSEDERK